MAFNLYMCVCPYSVTIFKQLEWLQKEFLYSGYFKSLLFIYMMLGLFLLPGFQECDFYKDFSRIKILKRRSK